MKICLVRLPSPFLIDDRAFPPLGILAVGTALSAQGHEVEVYDGPISELPLGKPCYGMGPTTPEYPYALEVKNNIKRYNRDSRVIIGGSYATLNFSKCLLDGFDCVVVGDGENAAEVALQGESRLIFGRERPLDEYPIIDRSLVNIKSYTYRIDGKPATSMVTSRGCPFKCGFCSKNYKTLRVRSAGNVIAEIKKLRFEFGYEALAFSDDLFIVDKKRVEEIAVYLREWGISWRCLIRADIAVKWGEPFVRMMKNSGCSEVGMGVESGSNSILQTINKGENVETIKAAVSMLKSNGVRVKGFFILGLPGESPDTLDETEKFLEEAGLDDVDIKIFQPYPGSPIWDNRDDYDVRWSYQDPAGMYYKGRPGDYMGDVSTSHLANEQIVARQRALENRFKRWI